MIGFISIVYFILFIVSIIISSKDVIISLFISLLPLMIRNLTISIPLHTAPVYRASPLENLLEHLAVTLILRKLHLAQPYLNHHPCQNNNTQYSSSY